MACLKSFSALLAAFGVGIFAASLVWFVFFQQTSGRVPLQSLVTASQVSIPSGLGDSIRLQNNAGSTSQVKNPFEPGKSVDGADKGRQGDQPVYGAVTELPPSDDAVNAPPAPEVIELPLESKVNEAAPEPEIFANVTDMAVVEEPLEPGVVENAPVPSYQRNK